MQDELSIPFKLINIEENQFSIFEELLNIDLPIKQNIGFGFSVDIKEKIIGATFRFQLNKEERAFLKIEATCYFQIEETAFQQQLQKGKEVIIPVGFAKHLAVISTGTARGILYANTKDTAFNEYFLGLVDINNLFQKDIVLEI